MALVYLSLGSNLGDQKENIKKALALLPSKLKILKQSKIYETEPYGKRGQPWFYNMCVSAETDMSPQELLQFCLEVEQKLGRERKEKWGPRNIDVDILFYDSQIINTPELITPHPDLQNRLFVLTPLSEIAEDLMHPILKKSVSELLKECRDPGIVRAPENDHS